MSEITLSKAVRSNLLNLQNTAGLLSKAQERLSSGLRVNSALDNPTNYFTAQGLNSRANDLSQLADAVSNAVQTVAAADKGISAITKLVESAQATARQALQTAATVETTTAATAGSITAGAFTAVDVSGSGSAATAATLAQGNYTPVDLSGVNTLTFDLTVDGTTTSISLDNTITAADNTAVTAQELADAINGALGGGTVATVDGTSGDLVFTSGSTGTGSDLTVANVAGTAAANSGITAGTDTGADAVAADSISFTVAVDGGAAQSVTIDAAAVAAYNSANSTTFDPTALAAADVAALINDQVGSTVASV